MSGLLLHLSTVLCESWGLCSMAGAGNMHLKSDSSQLCSCCDDVQHF